MAADRTERHGRMFDAIGRMTEVLAAAERAMWRAARVRAQTLQRTDGTAMSELLSPDAPRRLLSDLCRLVADRAAAESRSTPASSPATRRRRRSFRRPSVARRALPRAEGGRRAGIRLDARRDRDQVPRRARRRAEGIRVGPRRRSLARFTADQQAAEQALQDAHWEAIEAADAARGGLNLPLERPAGRLGRPLAATRSDPPAGGGAAAAARPLGRRARDAAGRPSFSKSIRAGDSATPWSRPRPNTATLVEQFLPRLFQGFRPLGIFLLLWLVAAVPSLDLFNASAWWNWLAWAAVSGGAAVLVGAGGRHLDLSHRQAAIGRGLSGPAAARCSKPDWAIPAVLETAKADCQRLDATIIARHKAQIQKADEEFAAATARIEHRRQNDLQQADGDVSQAAGRIDRLARPDAARRSRRSTLPCSARSSSSTPPSRKRLRARHDRPWRRAGSDSTASGTRWPSAGGRASSGSAVGRRSRRGVPRGVSRLEHRRLEPLDAAGGDSAGGAPSATAR